MRQLTALPLFVLAITACSAAEDTASVTDRLVGGHVASEGEYPATVSMGGCTGVKVGPRHFLSAAHCFSDPTKPTVVVTADNNAQNFVTLTVSSINISPEWLNCTACAGDGSYNDFGLKPDFALIIVQEFTPDIPQAVIDPTPVAVGDPVTLTGYGCENGVGQPSGPARFKVGDTHAVDPASLNGAPSIPGGYNTTWGPELDPSAPGLCPGDSGGPLYRTGTNKVVGINALVSFNGSTGNPVGNWFTRLDQQSRYDVWSFIDNLIDGTVATPCAGICSSPTAITSAYFSSGSLGTGARCFETTQSPVAGVCGGFASSRTFGVNGNNVPCNGPSFALPPKRNGGYCFAASAGENSWAWFSTW